MSRRLSPPIAPDLRRLAVAGSVLAFLFVAGQADAQTTVEPPTGPDVAIFAVSINGSADEQSVFFLRRPDGLWIRRRDLETLRIVPRASKSITVDEELYVPLASLPGLVAQIDEPNQSIRLTAPAELFEAQRIDANTVAVPRVSDAIPAAFLNYNIALQAGNDISQRARGFFETGVSNRLGLFTSTFTLGKLNSGQTINRLDTYYLHDNPETATRLTVGDAITSTSAWSRPIRFGGVKYGTDFSLRPGFITFPTADFEGRTLLPSSVELYANGALRYRNDVNRGPFAVDQAPLPIGAGQLTVVTRDVLGIERRTTTPYYVSTNLLREGLSRYSVEFGAERDDYSLKSFDYSRPFAAGTYRYGLSKRLTVEGRAEIGERVQTVGGSLASALPRLGEFGATIAASEGGGGTGFLYGAYFSRVSATWDFGLSIQQTNHAFTQLGIRVPTDKILRQVQGNAGYSFPGGGRFGATIANLKDGAGNNTRIGSLSYSKSIGRAGFLDVFALRALSNNSRATSGLGFGFTIPFGGRGSVRLGSEIENGHLSLTGDLRVAPPNDHGFGYGASARLGGFDQQRADVTWRTEAGEVRGEVSHFDGASGALVTGSGSLVLADSHVFATRQMEGGFGIVEAGGYAGVQVYQDNRPLTRTDSHGLAIIPALRPYEENSIRLAPDDLPIGTRVDADDIVLTPGFRSGVIARFKVRTGHPGTLVIQGADGAPLPAGTPVSVDGGREKTFVGYDGELYVSNIQPAMTLEAELKDGTCRATLAPAANAATVDLPQLGPVRCVPGGSTK